MPTQLKSKPAGNVTPGQAASAATLTAAANEILGASLTLKRETARRTWLVSVGTDEVCFAVESTQEEVLGLAAAAEAGVPMSGGMATVSLRTPRGELVFFADVISVAAAPDTDPGADAPELHIVMRMPSEVIATQRRKQFRTAVSADDAITMRLWRIDDHAQLGDRPPASRELKAELRDLSENGLRALVFAPRVASLSLVEGQRFRISLQVGEVEMLLDGRQRHPRATARDDVSAECGIELIHRDDEIESRRNQQKLLALLSQIQRNAARRSAG